MDLHRNTGTWPRRRGSLLWLLPLALGCGSGSGDAGGANAGAAGGSAQKHATAASATTSGSSAGSGALGDHATGGSPMSAVAAKGNAGGAAKASSMPAANGDYQSMLTPPDPKIMFDWQETTPGMNDCQPGTYTGTFTCNYTGPGIDDSNPFVATGPVVFTLTKSQNGEFLEISDGHIQGLADGIFDFHATLQGQLDCSTNMLIGMAMDGAYGLGDADVLPVGAFEGALSGTLDRSSATLSGDWNLSITDGLGAGGACVGPWSATWMP
jgi:hypothetical protein